MKKIQITPLVKFALALSPGQKVPYTYEDLVANGHKILVTQITALLSENSGRVSKSDKAIFEEIMSQKNLSLIFDKVSAGFKQSEELFPFRIIAHPKSVKARMLKSIIFVVEEQQQKGFLDGIMQEIIFSIGYHTEPSGKRFLTPMMVMQKIIQETITEKGFPRDINAYLTFSTEEREAQNPIHKVVLSFQGKTTEGKAETKRAAARIAIREWLAPEIE